MNWLLIYLGIGGVWSCWAGWMQFKSGFSTRVDAPFVFCVLINWGMWPIGMLTAWAAKDLK